MWVVGGGVQWLVFGGGGYKFFEVGKFAVAWQQFIVCGGRHGDKTPSPPPITAQNMYPSLPITQKCTTTDVRDPFRSFVAPPPKGRPKSRS